MTLATFQASYAHQTSQAYLNMHRAGDRLEGRWDISLKDLHVALDLDANHDTELTWGEVKAALPRIDIEAIKGLELTVDSKSIQIIPTDHRIDQHLGSAYLSILWRAELPKSSAPLTVNYNFFFDVDPTHRALVSFEGSSTVLTHDSRQISGGAIRPGFYREGIWHIWTGFDHILFLLALLLPAVIGEEIKLPTALRQVAKVVTAFTIAHSITLSLAACGVILLPARIVEPIIGFSVLLAALNNLIPLWREKGWLVAFGFGLIHGFGFAEALRDLGLSSGSLAKCLFLFNAGVETGQLAIVAAFVPVAYTIRQSWFYRGPVLRFGSAMISLVASVWVIERLFPIKIF